MGTMEPQPQDKPVVLLASPRGFCAGVRRAIRIVELAIEKGKGPIYVRHEIVHNKAVVEDLAARGAVFVEELDEVPDGATVIFSAHGVGRDVKTAAAARSLDVIDATCPLVTKVHLEVARHARRGAHVILIGHRGHPEVVGTMGQLPDGSMTLVENPEGADTVKIPNAAHLAFAMQTTLSVDDARATVERLSSRFPGIEGPATDDICFATTNRQHAARQLAEQCDAVLVVGSANSSNSKRLMETAQRMGVSAQLIDDDRDINWQALAGITRIGVTAGASAPEAIVQRVAAAVAKFVGASEAVELEGVYERETFALPPRFRQADDPR